MLININNFTLVLTGKDFIYSDLPDIEPESIDEYIEIICDYVMSSRKMESIGVTFLKTILDVREDIKLVKPKKGDILEPICEVKEEEESEEIINVHEIMYTNIKNILINSIRLGTIDINIVLGRIQKIACYCNSSTALVNKLNLLCEELIYDNQNCETSCLEKMKDFIKNDKIEYYGCKGLELLWDCGIHNDIKEKMELVWEMDIHKKCTTHVIDIKEERLCNEDKLRDEEFIRKEERQKALYCLVLQDLKRKEEERLRKVELQWIQQLELNRIREEELRYKYAEEMRCKQKEELRREEAERLKQTEQLKQNEELRRQEAEQFKQAEQLQQAERMKQYEEMRKQEAERLQQQEEMRRLQADRVQQNELRRQEIERIHQQEIRKQQRSQQRQQQPQSSNYNNSSQFLTGKLFGNLK
jgi:hypothetical protein